MDDFKNEIVNHLPDINSIVFKRIHKKYLSVILLQLSSLFALGFTGVFVLMSKKFPEQTSNFSLYVYLILSLVFISLFIYSIIGFSRRKYAIRDKDISYKSGVITLTTTTVPFSRIQHIEIDESPISRLFNLASISVYTAGDSSDDLKVKGLEKHEALQIKDFITEKINGK